MQFLATSLALCLSFLLHQSPLAEALKLHGVRTPRGEHGAQRRAQMWQATPDLQNESDLKYFTNISLNGVDFPVLIDTGSSDLWVAGKVPGAGSTGKTAKVEYAIGGASGPILTAKMEVEGFTITNQAFILDTSGDNPDGQGLIGLGPNLESSVHTALNSKNGDAPLDRIFRDNMSTPNFLTIYLGRSDDPTNPFPGDITIGSVLEGYENITSQPKLPVSDVRARGGQHWQSVLDTNGILGPDGQHINITSHVSGIGKNQAAVVFDSGFSLNQVSQHIADSIYARIPGAVFQNVTGFGQAYTLPCSAEVNVTFLFHNISFPIHPLDATLELNREDDLGSPLCVGTFQPSLPTASASTFDMILGMAFLRNAYILINFGDFVDGASSKTADPYIQLLPLTSDRAEAHSDFVNVRLMGIDDTGNYKLLPASVVPPDNSTGPADNDKSFAERIHPYLPYIIAGSAVLGLILILSIIYCIMGRRRERYHRLDAPAPRGLEHIEPFERYRPARRY
ncbi:acid protease [Trametopsis cervina]|nr:acid protease [Trametopsis cervina]